MENLIQVRLRNMRSAQKSNGKKLQPYIAKHFYQYGDAMRTALGEMNASRREFTMTSDVTIKTDPKSGLLLGSNIVSKIRNISHDNIF